MIVIHKRVRTTLVALVVTMIYTHVWTATAITTIVTANYKHVKVAILIIAAMIVVIIKVIRIQGVVAIQKSTSTNVNTDTPKKIIVKNAASPVANLIKNHVVGLEIVVKKTKEYRVVAVRTKVNTAKPQLLTRPNVEKMLLVSAKYEPPT